MSAPLTDKSTGDIIAASHPNDIKDYIEDGTYRVSTAWLTMATQGGDGSIGNNSIFVDSNDGSKVKYKNSAGKVYTLFAEKLSYTGANCSGSPGEGRTLTVSKNLTTNVIVIVGGRVLMETLEYTVSDAVITFLIYIDDSDKILVIG